MILGDSNPLELDHLAICAANLSDGVAYAEDCLGVALSPGGEHVQMGTHNQLLSLGPSTYLEVIAINPDAPPPARARWFELDRFCGPPRLTNWVARADDLAAAIVKAPAGSGDIVALKRGDLRWQMAVPKNGRLPFNGLFPGLISWGGPVHPATQLKDVGCRLLSLDLYHPDAETLRGYLEPMMGADRPNLRHSTQARIEALVSTPTGERLIS